MMSKEILILNGPNREGLFDALKLISEKRSVDFQIKNSDEWKDILPARITGIVSRALDGESWVVTACFDREAIKASFLPEETKQALYGRADEIFHCRMVYSTITRQGKITPITL